jgi:hypothetical protein
MVRSNNPRENPDKAIIDKIVDWRKANRPTDTTDIKVNLAPEALNQILKMPLPRSGQAFPASCLYRGYRIVATKTREKAGAKTSPPASPSPSPREVRTPYSDS